MPRGFQPADRSAVFARTTGPAPEASWFSVTIRRPAAWPHRAVVLDPLRPQAGHLIFFEGREHPHYVRALRAADDIRVVAVMNYYTDECPESTRPPELSRHLYGDR